MSDAQPADNVPEDGQPSPGEANAALPHEDRFPALAGVLETYYASGDEDAPSTFIEQYWQYGEEISEFEGLDDELKDAIRNPGPSSELVNFCLGSTLSRGEVRHMLSEQRDILLRRGKFSEDSLEEQAEEEEASPQEVINGSFKHKVTIPFGRWKGKQVQLWHVFLAGGVVVALGALPLQIFSLPGWLVWIPILLIVLGAILVFFSGIAILGLRSELLDNQETAPSAKTTASKDKDDEESSGDSDSKPTMADRIRRMLT